MLIVVDVVFINDEKNERRTESKNVNVIQKIFELYMRLNQTKFHNVPFVKISK